MYDDLLLFEKTQAGRFRFLVNEESSMVGQSYLWGFSQGGKYLVIESTEEGHAGYQIYEAEAFIEFPQTTHASFVVYDYYLPSLIALDDDGAAIFERMQDGEKHNHADCLTNIEDYEYEPDYPVCLVKIDLLALDAKN
ncbi:hypothetical protein [Glaciecola sp. 1036]|uniref:hypothetical protein n=1 Tax=Alteromonadaceae TaxID=72275 RepID=UPI003D034E53